METQNSLKWPIIGHREQLKFLGRVLINRSYNHAYIFHGPKHVGKATVAKLFSQSIVCLAEGQAPDAMPCGQCQSCGQFRKSLYPDYFEIRPLADKKDIGIEQIKELQSHLKLKSFLNNYKIVLIDEAEKLNQVSSNAILKTLEEPADKTVIILVTDDLNSVLPTIVSRSLPLKFGFVKDEEIYDYFKEKVTREEALLAMKLGQGRPGTLLNGEFKTIIRRHESTVDNLEKLIAGSLEERFKMLENFLKNKEKDELEQQMGVWLTYFRDILLAKTGNADLVINFRHLDYLRKIERIFTKEKLLELILAANDLPIKIRMNIGPRMLLENLILKI